MSFVWANKHSASEVKYACDNHESLQAFFTPICCRKYCGSKSAYCGYTQKNGDHVFL